MFERSSKTCVYHDYAPPVLFLLSLRIKLIERFLFAPLRTIFHEALIQPGGFVRRS